jgi:chromosome partitioning protein
LAILTLLNQKGGVGKTSTCYHLAGTLAQLGRRVLLVDNDPQSSLTQGFLGPQATRQINPAETIAGIYSQDALPDQAIRPTGVAGVDLGSVDELAPSLLYVKTYVAARLGRKPRTGNRHSEGDGL